MTEMTQDDWDSAVAPPSTIDQAIALLPRSPTTDERVLIIQRIALEVESESEMDKLAKALSAAIGIAKSAILKDIKAERKKNILPAAEELKPYIENYAHILVGGKYLIVDKRSPKEENSLMMPGDFISINRKDRIEYMDSSGNIKAHYWAKTFVELPPTETKIYKKGFVFDPRTDATDGDSLNLFTGMCAVSKDGASCSLFKELIFDIWCGGDQELGHWVWEWLLHIVGRPWERCDTAIAIQGEYGTGKSVAPEMLREILCDMLLSVEKEDQVLWTFNGSIKGKLLIVLEEAAFGNDPAQFDRMKHLITSARLLINDKFKPAYEIDNYARILLITNHSKMLHTDANDRRYTALNTDNVAAERWKNENKYSAMWRQWHNGGKEAFLWEAEHHVFRKQDGSDRLVIQQNFKTTALQEQMALSRRGLFGELVKFILEGEVKSRAGGFESIKWPMAVPLKVKSSHLLTALADRLMGYEKVNANSVQALRSAFRKLGIELDSYKGRIDGKRALAAPNRREVLNIAYSKGAITQSEYNEACCEHTEDLF